MYSSQVVEATPDLHYGWEMETRMGGFLFSEAQKQMHTGKTQGKVHVSGTDLSLDRAVWIRKGSRALQKYEMPFLGMQQSSVVSERSGRKFPVTVSALHWLN